MFKTCLNKAFFLVLCVFQMCLAHPAASEPKGNLHRLTRKQYIEKYKDIAVRQMHAYGIPASIILAQACLESGDGNSRLARQANNHFGIKCHEWEGDRIYHDDDAPGECFRKYRTAEDSFFDHSVFLRTRPRYASLFDLEKTDYKGWAHGLKQAGYATNPRYALLLIEMIETNGLYLYDLLLPQEEATEGFPRVFVPQYAADSAHEGEFSIDVERRVMKTNGVRYVLSAPGDTYRSLAAEFGLFTRELMRFNDVPHKTGLAVGEKVYLERKAKRASSAAPVQITLSDESLTEVAQRYGIRLNALRKLNPGMEEFPVQGTLIRLR